MITNSNKTNNHLLSLHYFHDHEQHLLGPKHQNTNMTMSILEDIYNTIMHANSWCYISGVGN